MEFDPDFLVARLNQPAGGQPQSKTGASSSGAPCLKKRKERAEVPAAAGERVAEGVPEATLELPCSREEPAPYRPNWAINVEDSVLSDVRTARELVEGSRLPVDRSILREKTSGTIMGASQQSIATALLHVGEMVERLQLTMDLNSTLEDEKNAVSVQLSDAEREMHEAMDKLGSSQSEERRLQAELSKSEAVVAALKKEAKKAGKRAVEGFKASVEYRNMVADSSAIAYSMGVHRLLDHLRESDPNLQVAGFAIPRRVTQAGLVQGEGEKEQEKAPAPTVGSQNVERTGDSQA